MAEHTTQLAGALAAEERKLLACVHCGLCLEACPTYVHTGDENDSPRGRIYLMRAVEEGRLALDSDSFSRHIDRCLGCRACESACPAGVEYGQLLEAARADIAGGGRPEGWTSRALRLALRHVWSRPARLRLAFALARLLRDSRLPQLLLASKLTKLLPARLELALALLDSSRPARPAAGDAADGDVKATGEADASGARGERTRGENPTALLFEGCVTEGLFARVNRATARVLAANGCASSAPRGQVCCGALHAHAGDLEGARRLARRNVEAFETEGGAAVVTNAGGCGAMLASYAHLLASDPVYAARARDFSSRVRDVSQQLAATGIERAGARPAGTGGAAVTYDASCHLLHGQKAQTEPLRVLGAVEGVRVVPLEGSEVCCGGAGVYNLLETELSSRVLAEKLARVRETGAEVLATGNPGCHMQLGAGARLAGLRLRVVHPVELLDESYRRAGLYSEGTQRDWRFEISDLRFEIRQMRPRAFPTALRTFAAAALLLAASAAVGAQTAAAGAPHVERVRALYEAAKAREAAGDWAGAERDWAEVVSIAPEDARAWVNLGAARSRQERRAEAIEAWSRAISLDPRLAGAHFNLGLALVRGGEAAAAVAPLRRALALEPENEAARRALAVALVGAERYREASRELAQLLARAPRDAALLDLAARSFLRQRRYAEAVTVARRLLDLGGATAEAWAMYGDALDGAHRTGEAAEAYERAVKLDPDSNPRRYALGYLYWKLYRYDEAEPVLAEVLRRDPADARAAFTLGDLYLTRGQAPRALPLLEQAARAYPSEFDTRFALGRAMLQTGDAARAVEELSAAVKLRDDVADGHYQLGRALTLAGRKEEGRRELERARALQDRKRESEAPKKNQ